MKVRLRKLRLSHCIACVIANSRKQHENGAIKYNFALFRVGMKVITTQR